MAELGTYVLYTQCPLCKGIGTIYNLQGGPTETLVTCPNCSGEKYIIFGYAVLDDILDKLNDIKEQCDEIKSKLDEM